MGSPGRPTQRCLSDCLDDGWGDVTHQRLTRSAPLEGVYLPPLSELDHPIVRHAAQMFSGNSSSDGAKESISGLFDPPFWKVKTGRWRGAVWEDDATGQCWLVAAGLRYEGESKDFYARFMADVQSRGAEYFLPTSSDWELLDREQLTAVLQDWEIDLHQTALDCVEVAHEAPQEITVTLWSDGESVIADVMITVEIAADADDPSDAVAEVTVECTVREWEHYPAVERAEMVIMTAICPHEQDWSRADTAEFRIVSLTTGLDDLTARVERARYATPGQVIAGSIAHYAHKGQLTAHTVNGTATRALCGVCFVPRQDHERLPVCPHCERVQALLVSAASDDSRR